MKKTMTLLLAALLAFGLLAGCAGNDGGETPAEPVSQPASSLPAEDTSEPEETPLPEAGAAIRVAGLKGPTTMGMVTMMDEAEQGLLEDAYEFEMFGTADEIVPKLVGGELDIAAIPANLASVLYNNSQAIQVAAINTLGVLYVVETGQSINAVADLAGKTVYSTGKGTTPEFALNYILTQNGLDPAADLTIEYKSESTEIAALMAEADDAVAVLPQPYVTALMTQNEKVRMALSLSDEWDKVSDGSGMVTGVLVARKDFISQNGEAFARFMAAYEASINAVNTDPAAASELVAKYGIVEKAPIAEKAIPYCNIVCITGEDMKAKLAGYLEVLHGQLPEAVGGAVPADDFYFI